ncbi:MAG: LysR family transcriptional regulator [Acidobacteria bacterium]|nr:LysR family transcriptional regulator [Acidobacteriota bacterium]
MDALNHHHLFHFWTVVREGGVTRASEKLNVSQPTVSGQLRELQEALGEKLLVRSGRTVVLTDVGRTVYRYADEIFALGRELQDAVRGRVTHPARLAVGVTMVVPKLIVYQILEPALELPEPIQLDCVHERPERLVAELAVYSLDVVLADTPAPPAVKVRAYSHVLGECGVSVFATEKLATAHRRRFPRSLNGAPFLLPSGDSGLRLSLEEWFRKQGVRPRIVGTFEDSAVIDAFGRAGAGLFALPTAIEKEVRRQYGVRLVGRLDTVRQRFYAITVERTVRNPAVIAISERARALFA